MALSMQQARIEVPEKGNARCLGIFNTFIRVYWSKDYFYLSKAQNAETQKKKLLITGLPR